MIPFEKCLLICILYVLNFEYFICVLICDNSLEFGEFILVNYVPRD